MSLPTPPATSHHRDKENRVPGSRVAWAQQNQYFILSYSPTFSAPHPPRLYAERPAKSILKKRVHAPLLPPEECEREVTPEPEDPLVDLTYLSRPVHQIISPDSTLHDIIEAYSILHARLRAAVASSTDADASWPLFQPLRKNIHAFTEAVVRDLGRALIEPKSDLGPGDDIPVDCDKICEDEEALSLLPSPKQSPRKKKQGMSASQIKFARDLCTTTHAVLRLLSAIFTLPPLYQIFDDAQLRDMLTHVLAIPMADELPTPNARKTCALSIWLLQVQRLPEIVLLPARDRIAFALRRGMEGELGKEGKKGSACDGLKAIHDLSLHQPATFIPAFTELLPSILANLLAPTLGLRTQACHALGGFVLGCVSLPCSSVHVRISKIVSTFLTSSATSSPHRTPVKSTSESGIIRTLRTTLNTIDPQHVAQGPVWALSVLASLIVLLGPLLCTDVRLTRIVSALLSLAMRNKKSSVRALASLLWRCVVWAYLRPPLELSPEDGEGHEEFIDEQDIQLARESFWKLVKSVVDMGTGVSTVAALLGDNCDNDDRLKKALRLVKIMLNKGGQTALDAIDIAKILVNCENNGKSWSSNNLLPHSLFSSNPGLLTADYKTLSVAVKPIFDECPQLEDIRPLTRDQLSKDWVFNELTEIWRATLGLEILEDCCLPSETLATWSGLLKANVTVFLDADDYDGVVEFAAKTVGILAEILRDSELDLTLVACPTSSKIGSPSKATKSRPMRSHSAMKLEAARELWGCMRTIFPNNLLHLGGAKLLECLVENESELVWETDSLDTAREEWAKLCAETLAVCEVEELEKFWAKRLQSFATMTYEPGVQSLVWGCFVETWTADREASWEGATILLGVPFDNRSAWELSNDEFGVWDGFLRHAMNKANDNGMDAMVVLDNVASVVARCPCPAFASSIRIADLLLSHCEMDDIKELPTNVFELVNDTLISTYPPEPRNLKPSMWLIASLTRAVDTCPVYLRLGLLEAIQDGISAWLSDEYRVFTRDEYALDVLPLYQTALLGIQELPHTLEVLKALSCLLQSVFIGRDDKPRVAREAFTEFWTTTIADVKTPESGWPEDLQLCLLPPEEGLAASDTEPSSDLEELEDATVYAPSSANGESENLSCTPPSSPLGLGSGSLCSVRTVRASEDKRTSSPFIGHLGPALFTPLMDLKPSLASPARSVSPTTTCAATEPSTPTTGSRSFRVATPPRPHKPTSTPESFQSLLLKSPAGTLPVHPITPTTPRSACTVRSSLSSGKGRGLGDKENVSPLPMSPTLGGIYSTPSRSKPLSVLGKRQMIDESPRESAIKRGRTSFIRSSIEFPSANDSDLQDELVVEAVLSSSARKAQVHYEQPPASHEMSQTTTTSRKRKRQRIVMEAVVVPSLADIQRRQSAVCRRASTDCVGILRASPSLRRSSSMPKLRDSHNDEAVALRRKRLKRCDDVDTNLSSSLTSLEETVIAGSDDSIMLPLLPRSGVPGSEGSDDDPHLGQVSPRHLASPAPRRYMDPDYNASSDDAPSSSPSRDLVARRQQRFGLLTQSICR